MSAETPRLVTRGSEPTFQQVTHEYPRFDWYQATVEMPAEELLDLAATSLGDEAPVRVAGKNGYARGWEIRRAGCRSALVFGGGSHEHPHIVGTGDDSDAVAALVRTRSRRMLNPIRHRVSRVDVAVDTDTPGAFRHLFDGLRACAINGGVKATLMHDPDRASEGATYYVGSQASEVRARLYEKGKQLPDAERPDWVRYEVQIRPQKSRKVWAAGSEAVDLLGASRWSREFAGDYLGLDAPAAPTRSERVSDLEGALRTLTTQYAGRLMELAQLHAGDLGALGQELIVRAMNEGLREEEAS